MNGEIWFHYILLFNVNIYSVFLDMLNGIETMLKSTQVEKYYQQILVLVDLS
jgi:hypothetical protein